MSTSRIFLWVVSIMFNAYLIYQIYFEAGKYTAIMAGFFYITFLLQAVLNAMQKELNSALAEFAGKVGTTLTGES